MKRAILRKLYVVLALVAFAPLGLASVTGNTLAYLQASDSLTNTFTFAEYQPPLGNNRTDRVNYYYLNKSGTSTQIRDSGYTNNTWTYRANERVYVNSSNTNIKNPPNGFRLAYVTVAGNRVNAGSSFLQPNQNNTAVNVYFEPITYTISYDYNGYNESDITFSETPLQSTYTVFDMVRVPYESSTINPYSAIIRWLLCDLVGNSSIRCRDDVPSAHVDSNTLLGWEDQGGTVHTYSNASGSWADDIGTVSNTGVYSAFSGRQSGDLTLTARWQYEVAPQNNSKSLEREEQIVEPEEVVFEEKGVENDIVEEDNIKEDQTQGAEDDAKETTE